MYINSYSDLTIKTPDCHVGSPVWVARFHLDADVSELFPYINAVIKEAKYLDKPRYIQFTLDDRRCALYPDHAVATPFMERNEAVAFIGRLIGFLNDLFDRKATIAPNYREYQPLPILKIYKLLPRTNCKVCGFETCMAFACVLSGDPGIFDRCPAVMAPEDPHAIELRAMLA